MRTILNGHSIRKVENYCVVNIRKNEILEIEIIGNLTLWMAKKT